MVSVEITNYESIAHVEFSFSGFSTLIGDNTLGKSATLRAINAALTNKSGDDFIKWGQKFCEVRIKTNDADILWHKEKSNSYYIINNDKDHPLTKLGRDSYLPQIDAAGLGLIVLDKDNKVNLHYADQFHSLFLVDKKDEKSADLLLSIYHLDKLYKAFQLCNKDQVSNSSLLKTRREDLEYAKSDLKKFDGVEEVIAKKESLVNEYNDINKQSLKIDKLKETRTEYIEAAVAYKKFKPITEVKLPSKDHITLLLNKYTKLVSQRDKYDVVSKEVTKYGTIRNVTLPLDLLKDTQNKHTKLVSIKKLAESYNSTIVEIDKLKNLSEIVLPEMPSIDFSILQKIKEIRDNLLKHGGERKKIEIDLEKEKGIFEVLDKKLKEYKTCPACGKEL